MDDLVSHAPENQWSGIAPLRILSFDIECAGRKGAFPEATQDPVIQIASVVTVQGEKQPRIRAVFSYRSCAPIVGADVLGFEREEEMLMAWIEFFQTVQYVHRLLTHALQVDPDIVIGYNICNFDFGYLLDRAHALKLSNFPFLGRLKGLCILYTSLTTNRRHSNEKLRYVLLLKGLRHSREQDFQYTTGRARQPHLQIWMGASSLISSK